jgi:hypothetical protein
VVRPASPTSAIAWVLADSTYAAYNAAGGQSLYPYQSIDKTCATTVSFDRPQHRSVWTSYHYDYGIDRVFIKYQSHTVPAAHERATNVAVNTDQAANSTHVPSCAPTDRPRTRAAHVCTIVRHARSYSSIRITPHTVSPHRSRIALHSRAEAAGASRLGTLALPDPLGPQPTP